MAIEVLLDQESTISPELCTLIHVAHGERERKDLRSHLFGRRSHQRVQYPLALFVESFEVVGVLDGDGENRYIHGVLI